MKAGRKAGQESCAELERKTHFSRCLMGNELSEDLLSLRWLFARLQVLVRFTGDPEVDVLFTEFRLKECVEALHSD